MSVAMACDVRAKKNFFVNLINVMQKIVLKCLNFNRKQFL